MAKIEESHKIGLLVSERGNLVFRGGNTEINPFFPLFSKIQAGVADSPGIHWVRPCTGTSLFYEDSCKLVKHQ